MLKNVKIKEYKHSKLYILNILSLQFGSDILVNIILNYNKTIIMEKFKAYDRLNLTHFEIISYKNTT